MITRHVCCITFLGLLVASGACGGAAPEPASPSTTPTAAPGSAVATKPDRAKVIAHLKEHVKYPIGRAELLKACADTPEFTAGEKKWFEANVPEGTFASADEAIAAVKP